MSTLIRKLGVILVAERVREYEVVIILSPEATEDEISTSVERIDGLITDGGGTVGERESWGLKRLSYPIKGFKEGNYFLTKFSMAPDGIEELNRIFTGSEDIVRFLITRT
tara:strand:+ start:170 stop:499 length:330 start_codon:yes stop_codon:yes gene_type:complete